MDTAPLKNQIIAWLRDRDYWFQYASNRFLEGENISEELVSTTYEIFKEEYNLIQAQKRPAISFNEIPVRISETSSQLLLNSIKNIQNVNALAVGQEILINSNLTVIYGANGTGKSGYVRMLNNVFNSRGDKDIIHNVFEGPKKGDPNCKFTFRSSSGSYELQYPEEKDKFEFTQFSVLDTQSIKVLLEQDNKLNFTPSGFEIFEKILELYEILKSRLNFEIKANRLNNYFTDFFSKESPVRMEILGLSASSNEDNLKLLADFNEDDEAELISLTEKKQELESLNIPKKTAELQTLLSQCEELINRQGAVFACLTEKDVKHYESMIDSFYKLQNLTKQEGIKSLEDFQIEQLGSSEWKEFIRTSRIYTSLIEKKSSKIYPSESDSCLFCLQPLTDKEHNLINSYWNLLKSISEGELNRKTQEIRDTEKKLKGLSPAKFDNGTLFFQYVTSINPELAEKWKQRVASSWTSLQNVIINLSNRNFNLSIESFDIPIDELYGVRTFLKSGISNLFLNDRSKELNDLQTAMQFLIDKRKLKTLIDKVLILVSQYKWSEKAEGCISIFNTKAITIKQGELFNSHITEKYLRIFNEECQKLGAPQIVNIVQRNERISTLRKLQVRGLGANSILSEGEQKAISLADFLTETQLNPNNKGVFFDDPVTSLDHVRKGKIAKRLVELSIHKQVTIFTHDASFLIQLRNDAEELKVPVSISNIRNVGGSPGMIKPDSPWIAQNVKARIATLRDRLLKLKKMEKEDSDDYFLEAKSWYGLLREAWERAVEERLFKGVIERFYPGVQTNKLSKVVITDDLLSMIKKGMSESSNWVHDAAAGLNPTYPDTTKAQNDLDFLADFAAKCDPA